MSVTKDFIFAATAGEKYKVAAKAYYITWRHW